MFPQSIFKTTHDLTRYFPNLQIFFNIKSDFRKGLTPMFISSFTASGFSKISENMGHFISSKPAVKMVRQTKSFKQHLGKVYLCGKTYRLKQGQEKIIIISSRGLVTQVLPTVQILLRYLNQRLQDKQTLDFSAVLARNIKNNQLDRLNHRICNKNYFGFFKEWWHYVQETLVKFIFCDKPQILMKCSNYVFCH